jgi:D-serine dehydratase
MSAATRDYPCIMNARPLCSVQANSPFRVLPEPAITSTTRSEPGHDAAMRSTRMARDPIRRLRTEPLPIGTKGLPLGDQSDWTIDSIVDAGWNVLDGQLPLPLLTLSNAALGNNIETMAAYCRERKVLLAPHGKTTMAPQLFERQIAAGCWAITAATPTHLSLYRTFGVDRILYANELVEPAALRWLASELNRERPFSFYSLVDSTECVARMASVLEQEQLRAPVNVLIEIGHPGGRSGCRTLDAVCAVADAVLRSPCLRLAGVEAFEGTIDDVVMSTQPKDGEGTSQRVEAFLTEVVATVRALSKRGSLDSNREIIVTAGGSAYFDLVIGALAPLQNEFPSLQVVLRSGSYVTHDGGYYARTSPLGERKPSAVGRLVSALELWSVVLSRPEPDLVIVGAGKRDLPIDMGPPFPTRIWTAGRGIQPVKSTQLRVSGVSDQHLNAWVSPDIPLDVGDLCAWSISHPCTAFDKWRLIPLVDDDLAIVDAVRTFF